ncbi:MAG: YtxH domain-containing protein [Gammaproteobacteria bacterium]
MNSNSGSNLGFVLLGLGVGAIAGLLLAPRAGEETRKLIRERADEGRDYLKTKAQEFSDQAEDLAEKGREWLDRGRDAAKDAFDYGKQTYREGSRKT